MRLLRMWLFVTVRELLLGERRRYLRTHAVDCEQLRKDANLLDTGDNDDFQVQSK